MDDADRARLRDLVHRAHEALGEVTAMQARCPADVDRFDWSADLLDELARVALQVGDAAATLAGGEDDELERRSRELATTIVRRRNDALTPLPAPRRRLPTRPDGAALLGSPRALT
ncbi:hypothetical protein [Actinomycetospora termitidis]|uniref:Uncharacterized protein n=1 Tax=Actinomycetospora termitidis TaxID=3053470 RepID=A0ABT7M3M0_9PSEU|nr:hypothetical protein [Actinomycetospora sp. Odt1-22]MDL5154602.1 hypothetical protein [Actinomycetospora sp. Odt1-22]